MSLLPDFACIACSEKSIKNLEMIANFSQLTLIYDTTFNLGDFFLSVLTYKNLLFENEPVISAMYLLHHRKNKEVHEDFFSWAKKLCPLITDKNIITDREQSITFAIKTQLQNINHFECWNHIQQDVKHWIKKNKKPVKKRTYRYT